LESIIFYFVAAYGVFITLLVLLMWVGARLVSGLLAKPLGLEDNPWIIKIAGAIGFPLLLYIVFCLWLF
jgi:hypothetical protein